MIFFFNVDDDDDDAGVDAGVRITTERRYILINYKAGEDRARKSSVCAWLSRTCTKVRNQFSVSRFVLNTFSSEMRRRHDQGQGEVQGEGEGEGEVELSPGAAKVEAHSLSSDPGQVRATSVDFESDSDFRLGVEPGQRGT